MWASARSCLYVYFLASVCCGFSNAIRQTYCCCCCCYLCNTLCISCLNVVLGLGFCYLMFFFLDFSFEVSRVFASKYIRKHRKWILNWKELGNAIVIRAVWMEIQLLNSTQQCIVHSSTINFLKGFGPVGRRRWCKAEKSRKIAHSIKCKEDLEREKFSMKTCSD